MKVIKNSIIYAVVHVLKDGLNFFLLPVYTVYMTTQDYGIFSVVNALIAVMLIVVSLSLFSAGRRFHYDLSGDPEAVRTLWGTVYMTVLLNSFLVFSVFAATHTLFADHLFPDIPFMPFLLIGISTCVFKAGYMVYLSYLNVIQDGKRSGIVDLTGFVIKLSLILVLVAAYRMGAVGMLTALLITNGILFAYSFYAMRRHVTFRIDLKVLKRSLKYSVPLIPHALSAWVMTLVDRILLNTMTTTSEVGIYTIGFQIASVLNMLMVAINQAYAPFFYQKLTEGASGLRKIREFSELFVIFFSLVGCLMVLFSPETLAIIVAADFEAGWVVTPFLVFAFVYHGIYYMISGPLFRYRSTLVPFISIPTAALNVLLNYLLIPPYGKIGAAIASEISMIVLTLAALYMGIRVKDIGYKWKRMFLYTTVFFALSLIVFLNDILPFYLYLSVKVVTAVAASLTVFLINRHRLGPLYKMAADLRNKFR